jgi:glycosyltransferase involved in cell wall biosynthesis
MKLVSIVIPTYGGGDHLENTVDSIISQNYYNIEIIIVDDNGKGSKNQKKTQVIVEKYKLNKNIKYIVHEQNVNGSAARNTGAKASEGEYLGFIDDDDRYLPGKIHYQVNQLENLSEEWGASYSSKITKYNGEIIGKTISNQSGNLLYKHLMHKVQIGTGSMLVRRSVWEVLGGYDESFFRHQDWEFVGRLADKYKIVAAPEVYFERNFTFRNGPKNLEYTENLMKHFINNLNYIATSLTPLQRKMIVTNNYMGISLKYLRNRNIRKFCQIYLKYGHGLLGVKFITKIAFQYLIKNKKNGWLKKDR